MKKIKRIKDIDKLMVGFLMVLLGVLLQSYGNYIEVQRHVIEKEQQQLLTISKSISKSIELYFDYEVEKIKGMPKNISFRHEFNEYLKSDEEIKEFYSIDDYYMMRENEIEEIQVINNDFDIIKTYPTNKENLNTNIKRELYKVMARKTAFIGSEYMKDGNFYVRLYEPVLHESKVKLILSVEISLDKIYKKFVKPVKAGEKGYASVKNQNGVLLMHPKREDIGREVIKARKDEFPDYDWSELESIVEKQKKGESGVGIYHSIWYHDKEKNRIKKYSAYSPARIGDGFWIINLSMDYLEVSDFLSKKTYKNNVFSFVILLIFISFMIYIYKIKNDKKQLKIQADLSTQLNSLNKELEKDIEKRKLLEKELIKNKEKYESLFNSASDCIFVLNLDNEGLTTEFLEVNDKACTSLGYDKKQFSKMSYLDISNEGSDEKFMSMLQLLKQKRNIIFEDTLVTKDNGHIPVEISAHLFKLGNEYKIILNSRDMTNKKVQREALKRSEKRFRNIINKVATGIYDEDKDIFKENENPREFSSEEENKNRMALELEKINIELEKMFEKEVNENRRKEALMVYQSRLAAMGEMIGNIAHQWRQPLSGLGLIISNIEDAYYYNDLDEKSIRELSERGKKLILRMNQTIDDFRYFFNPKTEKITFSLKENIKNTIDFLQEHLRLHGINLTIDAKEDGMIDGHSNQYSQVIFNIVINSIDALVENRKEDRNINIEVYSEDNNHVVEIKDNGYGIQEDLLDKVFEAHFTKKNENKGTGLGLYMSKVIIEKNFNGKIKLFNIKEGLCVKITVPKSGVEDNE
ncbi:ATP-binding protein [Anaeromicrobium sediminis]|nr:ATP-binding protein [Anaeromicrobium sediminis]